MNAQPSVWIVDDDASIRWVLDKALSDAGWRTTVFDNAVMFCARFSLRIPM